MQNEQTTDAKHCHWQGELKRGSTEDTLNIHRKVLL